MKLMTLIGSAALITTFAAGTANAALVAGNSGGTFSNISNCGGLLENCDIGDTANGTDTQLLWGGSFLLPNRSTLTAVDRNWSVNTNANDVIIAQLTWVNLATGPLSTPDVFNANYTLTVNFTSPSGASDTELFNLVISNPTNPPGDTIGGLTLGDLANLSFLLNGVIVDDISYAPVLGNGETFNENTGVWFNPENNTAIMYITADFTAVNVPEPAALALFGAGLAGLGLIARRRRSA